MERLLWGTLIAVGLAGWAYQSDLSTSDTLRRLGSVAARTFGLVSNAQLAGEIVKHPGPRGPMGPQGIAGPPGPPGGSSAAAASSPSSKLVEKASASYDRSQRIENSSSYPLCVISAVAFSAAKRNPAGTELNACQLSASTNPNEGWSIAVSAATCGVTCFAFEGGTK